MVLPCVITPSPQVFESLTSSEQLGLMSALGSYHVWSSLGAPDGLHFRLDLTQPEQRDVAREVVKVGLLMLLLVLRLSCLRLSC